MRRSEDHIWPPYCNLHPGEVMVGVCAVCLKERLLVLASKQQAAGQLPQQQHDAEKTLTGRRRPSINLGRVFALGSFLQRLEINRHHRSSDDDDDSSNDEASIPSKEDSFISIKLEEDINGGHATNWHGCKKTMINTAAGIPYTSITCGSGMSIGGIKAGRRRRRSSSKVDDQHKSELRWRKRIGHLVQLAHWKRSSHKASTSHVAGRK
ncbi:hypothetical protein Cni_G21067 [Canna indica]|uniref:Uncharacterized protein n=1 Tax=Canna indica TaxID=4628 RepID=A0AAQ3QKD2_9LILI|nr:hypothetical protein Cni_G21067 [Canna indica]